MRILELFAGAGSVGKVFKDWGWEVVSLDRDMDADIRTDIMDWDYRTYEPGYFDVIWPSPPYTQYSRAKTVGVRKISAGKPGSATDPGHHTLSETCLLVLGETADWIVEGSTYYATKARQRCGLL